jgi:hypothetical protein
MSKRLILELVVDDYLLKDPPETVAHMLLTAFDEYSPSAQVFSARWEETER